MTVDITCAYEMLQMLKILYMVVDITCAYEMLQLLCMVGNTSRKLACSPLPSLSLISL